jgi:hypothetical protein
MVWEKENCDGPYGGDYSTEEGDEDSNWLRTPFTAIRWWTKSDLGTNPARYIRSWKATCGY